MLQDLKLISIRQAAELTGVSVRFWRKRVADRSLPVVKVGRLVRFRPEDFERYLTSRTRPAREVETCSS